MEIIEIKIVWEANKRDGADQVGVDVDGLIMEATDTGERQPCRA